jgi:hypothetical protein
MHPQFFSKVIIVIFLIPLGLGACAQAALNMGSASPAPGATATPASVGAQTSTSAAPPQRAAQNGAAKDPSTPEQRATTSQLSTARADGRAEELLRQVRETLGGETKLKEIRSFSASGAFRRVSNDQEQSGNMRFDSLLPDKFKVTETLNLIAGIEITIVTALNGNQAWTDTQSSAGNAQVMMVHQKGNEQNNNDEQVKSLRADLTRYMLSLFLMPPPDASIQFIYGGEAEAADGRADILELKGANGFTARLFIDKKTHRPLMMSYREVVMQMKTMKQSGGNRGDVDKIIKGAQEKTAAPKESDVELHFSDYRAEKGISLPHVIAKTVNGQPFEEWVVGNFKLNPPELSSQKFEKGK